MIEQFTIQNFQSHKDNTLEFVPGVNVIVGLSSSGKSAIFRAIRLLVENRPTGEEFISHWGGQMEVGIRFDDGRRVIRKRSTKVNEYHRFRENTTGYHRVYKAFGTDVPEEIIEILNIREINLQNQFAGPFLLAEETSPGEVAKHFNKVAKLDLIDEGVKNINSEIRQIEQNIKAYEMNIESSEVKLEGYTHLEKFEAEVEVLEELEKQYHAKMSNIVSLENLIDEIKEIDQEIEDEKIYLELETEVDAILDLIYQRDALEDGPITDISGILQELSAVNDTIEDEKQTLQELEERFKEEFPESCPLCGKPK